MKDLINLAITAGREPQILVRTKKGEVLHCWTSIIFETMEHVENVEHPWKINMEPKNHRNEKENHLSNLHFGVPC